MRTARLHLEPLGVPRHNRLGASRELLHKLERLLAHPRRLALSNGIHGNGDARHGDHERGHEHGHGGGLPPLSRCGDHHEALQPADAACVHDTRRMRRPITGAIDQFQTRVGKCGMEHALVVTARCAVDVQQVQVLV